MAKFGSYFGLCPLIDQKSLLGISEDHEADNVIVTLGKNIAMKYRLLDQKQISSWTTKEKFTSPVIFDAKTKKYVAVFNHLFVRSWGTEITNLDKVKKFKFKENIETVISINNMSFVVFETGDIVSLEYAIANHKTLSPEVIIDGKEEFIMEHIYCDLGADTYIGLLIGNRDSRRAIYLLWASFDSMGNKSEYSKLSMKSATELVGCCFQIFDQQIQILTLWSDGRLRVKSLEDPSEHHGESFCVIQSVSCENPVSMVSLDRDYLAIYGNNSNQEGALLIIYNMQFKVTQCMQPFKLQVMGVKLHKINEKLFVPVGQHLAVVPYHLEKEQLSALVGSHSFSNSKELQVVEKFEEVSWGESNVYKKKKSKTNSIISEYLIQGCPESMIFQNLLPEFIEKNNIADLKIVLKDFIDIPETCLAKVLFYILEVPEKAFKSRKLHEEDCYPECLQPSERYEILKIILDKPVNETNNKYWKMDKDNLLKVLKLILFMFTYEKTLTEESWKKIAQWMKIIMPVNLQTFLFYTDDELMEVLSGINDIIDRKQKRSEELLSSLERINNNKEGRMADSHYEIEKIYL